MTSGRTVSNVELPHRDDSKPALETKGDVDIDQELPQIDVGWPLLRYGNRFNRSISLWCEATPRGSRCSAAMPNNAQADSLVDAENSSGAVESSSDVLGSEITKVEEPIERQPPIAFLKPCRQLEKQYSATRRSIAGQLIALKGRLDRIAEDHSFRHSHGRFTANETASMERKEVLHRLRRLQSVDKQTKSITSGHVPRNLGENSCRISSTERSLHKKGAHDVALVAPVAAKFLAESFELPLYSSAKHNAVAIPFKWEDAPGKARVDTAARKSESLKLPPRLAPVRQHIDPSWMHSQAGKSNSQPKQLSGPHQGCHGNQPDQLPKSRSIHF